MFDASFWVAISFLVFCIFLIYKKIPQLISQNLDNQIEDIKKNIEDAKNLKKNSEELLLEYKKKITSAENEKNNIIENQILETEQLLRDTESKFKLSVENKKKSAEQKIEQMRVSAIKEIQQISNRVTFDVVKDILNDNANKNHIENANRSYLDSIYSEISEKKLNL